METLVLQDWTSIGIAANKSVVQAAPAWLDMAPFQDVVIWTETSDASASMTMSVQTSPVRDELLFKSLVEFAQGGNIHVFPIQVGDSPTIPIARWLRWSVANSSGSAIQVTFRIIVMANCQGSQST